VALLYGWPGARQHSKRLNRRRRGQHQPANDRVQKRMWRTNLIDVEGEEEQEAHALLKLCQSTHNGQWKRNYTIT
jgi:hypothetical protein